MLIHVNGVAMNKFGVNTVVGVAIAYVLTGCATSKYEKQRAEAAKELPVYEQAFENEGCFNLRFKFANGMSFNKSDALNSVKCLEIERSRDKLRSDISGTIKLSELTARRGYEDYRAIFTYLAEGEISLPKARELYAYAANKSKSDASAEMDRSNQLLARGLENQRRDLEQLNRDRALFLESMTRSYRQRPVTVTTCNNLFGTVTCTTQ